MSISFQMKIEIFTEGFCKSTLKSYKHTDILLFQLTAQLQCT